MQRAVDRICMIGLTALAPAFAYVVKVMDDNFDVMQLEHDDDDPERVGSLDIVFEWSVRIKMLRWKLQVEKQLENEKKLEARYQKLVAERLPQD